MVLAHEGVLVDHPSDPGGKTAYGISQRWIERMGLPLRVEDVDRAKAIELYERYFWNPYPWRDWPQRVAGKMFDMTVNAGPAAATRVLQRALRACGYEGVVDDGVVGPITDRWRQTAWVERPQALLAALNAEHAGFYRELAARRPELGVFLRGWLRRAYEEFDAPEVPRGHAITEDFA